MDDKTWRPSNKKYGVAICNYKCKGDQTLQLTVGEPVHIYEEYGSGSTGWYRGCLMSNKDKMGVFPACLVHIKPCDVQNEGQYETIMPQEDAMVREVAYVLREWKVIWTDLYVRNNKLYEKIHKYMGKLIKLRGRLADKKLTEEEANDIKSNITSVIDWGNSQLDLDLVPRIDGEQVDADLCSLTQLYAVHMNASKIALHEKPQRRRGTIKPGSRGDMVHEAGLTTHHLLVKFSNFGCHVGDSTETLLALYQYKDSKLVCLTEKFLVRHTKQMVPEDIEKLYSYNGLFTDLSSEEIGKDLYVVGHIYRIGGMKQDHSTKKGNKEVFKRPWGVGVIQLDKDQANEVAALNLVRLPTSFKEWEYQMRVTCCADNEDRFTGLHEQIIEKMQQGGGNPLGTSSKLGLNLNMFLQILHGDLATVKKEEPMLFSKGLPLIQKMGFTDDLSPGEVRNDLYVTLKSAELDRGNKKSQKNVEVKVTVLNEKGKQIEDCITYGCGEPPSSEYHTSVHYHSNKPEWNETIRISVPIDIFPGSHICFELFHCSVSDSKKEKREPYGFAFIKVTNEAQIVIKDSVHDLLVYKIDERHPWQKQKFFELPFLAEDLNDPHKMPSIHNKILFKANEKELLTIQTLLCSGKFTQNSDLLGILNWRGEQFAGELETNLDKLLRMQGDEIVKFLHDIMDALFDMLMDENSSKQYSNKIFKCMINIFTLIHHARFETFKPVLDAYISDTFSATLVHKPLCDCFSELIDSSKDERKTNLQLIQSFQDMDYIFRFIVQSRQLQRKDVYSRGSGDAREFHDNLQNVFRSMGKLLSSTSDNLKAYQMALLSHLHLVYPPLLVLLSEHDIAEFVKMLMVQMPSIKEIPEDITRAKLELMQKTVATKLFVHQGSRSLLLPLCLEAVKQCYIEKILMRSATDLLSDIMDAVFKLKQDFHSTCLVDIGSSGIKEDIEKIIQTIFDVVMTTIIDLKETFSTKDDKCEMTTTTTSPAKQRKIPTRSASHSGFTMKNEAGLKKRLGPTISNREEDTKHKTSSRENLNHPQRKARDTGQQKSPVSLLDWMRTTAVVRDSGFDSSSDEKCSHRLSCDGTFENSQHDSDWDVVDHTIAVVTWTLQLTPRHRGSMIACLMEMLRLMEEEHYDTLLHIYHRGEQLKVFLVHILEVFSVLVQPQVFPQDWTVMRMVTNNILFTSMVYFSESLKTSFLADDRFDQSVWYRYFELGVAFITQPSLQLDRYLELKAQKIRDRYQDMRVLMGVQLESLWHSLGKHKQHFIPSMVGPFLRLTLVAEEEVRKVTLPLIADIMIWDQKFHQKFSQVEAALIERLDFFLTQQHLGDAQYKDLFQKILLERVQSEQSLKESGPQFIISVTNLLERLLDYRQVVDGDENRDKRMHCTFNLLNFYNKEINREEMYIQYVNKLHNLHMLANNHAEAGLTLQLYAKVLKWTDNMLFEEMGYKQEKERDRKEALYLQIINCFDKGKVWEYALPLCKDLAGYYEQNLDYKKLSDILKQEAQFYEKILEGVPGEDPSQPDMFYPRQDPAYYRVAYYGQSFPAFVRNKQFIYRGDECLKLATIVNHLTAEFPSAQIMSINTTPSEDIINGEQQYIQISPVKPVPQERPEFRGKDVPLEIRNFYSCNEVDTFQLEKPYYREKKDPNNETKALCIERTKLTTAYKFPGILRWYEIKEEVVEHLCPIRVGVDQLKQSNTELSMLITRCQMNPKLFFPQLEMKLQGIITAPVNGGIKRYLVAFFTKDFERDYPSEVMFQEPMKTLLHEQLKILSRGMQLHGKIVPDNLMPLHRQLEGAFKELRKDVNEYTSPFNLSFPISPSLQSISSGHSDRDSIVSGRLSFVEDEIVVHPAVPGKNSPVSSQGRTGSDPNLNPTGPAGSPRTPGRRHTPQRRETFVPSVGTPVPALPVRRPSDYSHHTAPTIPFPDGPPKLPEKSSANKAINDEKTPSPVDPSVPPLPPRKGSLAPTLSDPRNGHESAPTPKPRTISESSSRNRSSPHRSESPQSIRPTGLPGLNPNGISRHEVPSSDAENRPPVVPRRAETKIYSKSPFVKQPGLHSPPND